MMGKKGKTRTGRLGLPQGVSALSKRFGEPKVGEGNNNQNAGREIFVRSAANVFGWLVQQWIRHLDWFKDSLGQS
jgi:hypothetical protein